MSSTIVECGSGAIGHACVMLGRGYVGLDNDVAWVSKAQARLSDVSARMSDEEALKLCKMWGKDADET